MGHILTQDQGGGPAWDMPGLENAGSSARHQRPGGRQDTQGSGLGQWGSVQHSSSQIPVSPDILPSSGTNMTAASGKGGDHRQLPLLPFLQLTTRTHVPRSLAPEEGFPVVPGP